MCATCLVDGRASTDDIRQALGRSCLLARTAIFITLSASPYARDSHESKQDRTFVLQPQTSVFLIHHLKRLGRRPVTRRGSALVVCARSMDESQHRSKCASPWHCQVVYSRRYFQEMEIHGWSALDPRPSCVNHLPSFFRDRLLRSWLRKDCPFVCIIAIILLI